MDFILSTIETEKFKQYKAKAVQEPIMDTEHVDKRSRIGCEPYLEEVREACQEEALDNSADASDVFPPDAFQCGDLLYVRTHKSGKKEVEGGKVKVVNRRFDPVSNSVVYDVRYVLWSRLAKNIHPSFLTLEERALTFDEDLRNALEVQDIDTGSLSTSHWVRRSQRYAGNDQLGRPDVQELIQRLERDDPNDADLAVLRLKNWLEADTNSMVLSKIFALVAKSKVVQALYVQNMEKAMDDETLELLTKALIENQRIWALNVGENFKITRKGWETFAKNLKQTAVTHIYAGSESTVHGELKVKMRDAVRENRSKHDLHVSRDNLHVIMQIGQMWWNPRNSKIVQEYRRTERGGEFDYHIGDKLVVKVDADGNPTEDKWKYGEIRDIVDGKYVIALNGGEIKVCIDLNEPKYSCTTKPELVFAERKEGQQQWPALSFKEAQVLVWISADAEGRIAFECEATDRRTSLFFVDPEQLSRTRNRVWKDSVLAAQKYFYGE